MPRTEAELARAQFGFGREREARGVGEGMEALTDFVAENAAQLVIDLLDLYNLLERGADEIAQRLPWFLAQNTQAGRKRPGLFQPRVARERGENFLDGKIKPEVGAHRIAGQVGSHGAQAIPLRPDQAGATVDPAAPASIVRALPGKRLSAGQGGVEVDPSSHQGERNRRCVGWAKRGHTDIIYPAALRCR